MAEVNHVIVGCAIARAEIRSHDLFDVPKKIIFRQRLDRQTPLLQERSRSGQPHFHSRHAAFASGR